MAKRSRRERRQEFEGRRRIPNPNVSSSLAGDIQDIPADPAVYAGTPIPTAPTRKTVNFAQEYYHVYVELRNIIIISILMFVVMWALQFLI